VDHLAKVSPILSDKSQDIGNHREHNNSLFGNFSVCLQVSFEIVVLLTYVASFLCHRTKRIIPHPSGGITTFRAFTAHSGIVALDALLTAIGGCYIYMLGR
jgi:hypothetical protein